MFLGQEVHYYIVHIAYYTKLNLQICDYAQNDTFVAKIVNARLTKICMAIFAFDEKLPTSATLKDWLSTSLKCLGFHCFNHHFWTQYFEVVICFFIFPLSIFAVSGLPEYCFFHFPPPPPPPSQA